MIKSLYLRLYNETLKCPQCKQYLLVADQSLVNWSEGFVACGKCNMRWAIEACRVEEEIICEHENGGSTRA